MRFEWEERKDRENRRKHGGISFELATLAFEDEKCLIEPDRVAEDGELRWHLFGAISVEIGIPAVLMVVHVYREDRNGEEVIRIISARRADKRDLRRYRAQSVD
jgi:uncharacterized DUF497 family protein